MRGRAVEFTITCPVDGPIEVGLEDIESVVVRDTDRADLTFVCPHCGVQITVTAIVPSFLLAAMEALADDAEFAESTGMLIISSDSDGTGGPEAVIDTDDPRYEAYCEYFRRQLRHIGSVDDALAEIDSVEMDATT